MGRRSQVLAAVALIFALGRTAKAQQKPDSMNLPDTPAPKQNTNNPEQKPPEKNGFATPLGLITKRSWFYPELARTPGPLSPAEKFELFLGKSMSPPQILSSAAGAGISQARDTLPGYGVGGEGYGKRFGSSIASGASSHFFGTFLLPAILHDDPRYFVKGNGRFRARAAYALRRTLVIRTDVGMEAFNWPGTMGPLAAEGLANSYLPDAERTAGKTFQRFGIRMGFGAANNLLKEYWPTIFKSLGMAKFAPGLKPEPIPPPTPPDKPPQPR